MVSVDVKHHVYLLEITAQELCESRGGRPFDFLVLYVHGGEMAY